jgi:MFS family permease
VTTLAVRPRRALLPVVPDTAARRHLGWRSIVTLSAIWFAIAYLMNTLGGITLPYLINQFLAKGVLHQQTISLFGIHFPAYKNTYVALLDTAGAVFALIWQPAIGALSDRSRFAIGRRRPYIMLGVAGDIVFLSLMAFVTSYWMLIFVYMLLQLASNTAQGPYQGMLPDQVPDDQRGEASGYYGLLQMVGTILGFVVVGVILIPNGHFQAAVFSYVAVIAVTGAMVIFGLPDVVTTRHSHQPVGKSVALSFAIDVKKYRDFGWLMISRLFFLMGPVGIGSFATNFIQDSYRLTPAKATAYSAILQAGVVVFAATMSMTAGFAARQLGKKRLVSLACLIGALGSALLITAPSLLLLFVFGSIVGISLGTFLSVDWAFMTDLIPKAEAGRYMGVSNIATVSSGLIARPILGPIIDAFNKGHQSVVGYRVMFGLVAVFYLIAWVTLRPVREIRVE